MTTTTRRLTLALTAALFVGALVGMTMSPARSDTPATDQQTQITCGDFGTTTTTVYLQQNPDGSWFVVDTVTSTDPAAVCTVINNEPDLSHVVYIVGRRSTGFVLVQDTGVNVLHPPQRVALRQCDRTYGPNTPAASVCRASERATQALLVSLRDLP